MTAATPSITDYDIQALKDKIAEAKRQHEHERLKQELHDITYKAAHTPTEFDGAMQIPDTDKVLKTKRKHKHFIEMFLERIKGMFSVRPILGNIIALLLSGIALFYIFKEVNLAGFAKYQWYFAIGIQIFAAIQIIKSGTRALLLPVLALVLGGLAAHSLSGNQTLFHFNQLFYQHLMIVGIIGLGVSILSID